MADISVMSDVCFQRQTRRSAPNSFFSAPLAEADPEIAAAIQLELGRQRTRSS